MVQTNQIRAEYGGKVTENSLRTAHTSVLAHGSVVQRRVLHNGRSLRVGYVEAVAVRPGLRRQGLGGQVMGALERVPDEDPPLLWGAGLDPAHELLIDWRDGDVF